MATNVRTTRISKELLSLKDCWPVDPDKLNVLEAKIFGADGTVFESGCFKLRVEIPDRYPFEPPRVRFLTKIYHPNIDKQGRICLDLLKTNSQSSWRPTYNIHTVLNAIKQLMSEPNPDDPLEPEIAQQYLLDKDRFCATAKRWTSLYANDNATSSQDVDENTPAISDDTGTTESSPKVDRSCDKTVTQFVPVDDKDVPCSSSEIPVSDSVKATSTIDEVIDLVASSPAVLREDNASVNRLSNSCDSKLNRKRAKPTKSDHPKPVGRPSKKQATISSNKRVRYEDLFLDDD